VARDKGELSEREVLHVEPPRPANPRPGAGRRAGHSPRSCASRASYSRPLGSASPLTRRLRSGCMSCLGVRLSAR
jgi:hypothetical protein